MIRRSCADCRADLDGIQDPPAAGDQVSHGTCAACLLRRALDRLHEASDYLGAAGQLLPVAATDAAGVEAIAEHVAGLLAAEERKRAVSRDS